MKRIVLFLATNLAIVLVLSLTMRILGVEPYLTANGLNLTSLLIFAAVMGFGGSFISLAISKWMAKKSMGVRVIETPSNSTEFWLVETVRKYAADAGIKMPEVGIFDSPQVNAFATGMTKNSALVAVSTGLLQQMDRDQVAAVLGHEIGHVANGDMVTMTLIQGVLNTLVILAARVVGRLVDSWLSGGRDDNRGGTGIGYFVTVMALQLVFGLFASMIVMAFSRWREFHADAAGAKLAGRGAMISALQRLQAGHGENSLPKTLAAFGISDRMGTGFQRLFMSHPPLEERIAALQNAA